MDDTEKFKYSYGKDYELNRQYTFFHYLLCPVPMRNA